MQHLPVETSLLSPQPTMLLWLYYLPFSPFPSSVSTPLSLTPFSTQALAGLSASHAPALPFPAQLPFSPFSTRVGALPAGYGDLSSICSAVRAAKTCSPPRVSTATASHKLLTFAKPSAIPGRNNGRIIHLGLVTKGWRLLGNTVFQLWLHLDQRKILSRQQLPFSSCFHFFSRQFFLFFDVCFLFFFFILFVFRVLLRTQLLKATSHV